MTPMEILSYRDEELNPYETNLHDCREALMKGLSEVEIEDDTTKLSRQTALFGMSRGSEHENVPYDNYHHVSYSSEKNLHFVNGTRGILRNTSAPTVGPDTNVSRKSNLKKKRP